MAEKTLTDRAKEVVVTCMGYCDGSPNALAELGKAYAAILTAEAVAASADKGLALLAEIDEARSL